jgi:hypothetical protein
MSQQTYSFFFVTITDADRVLSGTIEVEVSRSEVSWMLSRQPVPPHTPIRRATSSEPAVIAYVHALCEAIDRPGAEPEGILA